MNRKEFVDARIKARKKRVERERYRITRFEEMVERFENLIVKNHYNSIRNCALSIDRSPEQKAKANETYSALNLLDNKCFLRYDELSPREKDYIKRWVEQTKIIEAETKYKGTRSIIQNAIGVIMDKIEKRKIKEEEWKELEKFASGPNREN